MPEKRLIIIRICLILCLFLLKAPFLMPQDNPGNSIKIGLLVPDRSSAAALHGAQMAVDHANAKGGPDGRNFSLAVRSMEGPWGTGSKQAVDLIFNEKVWALLGSHDGRNAHLVEQAATKSIVAMISAWSADPTLTQAFVPWFFNCVPNDLQQAETILGEVFDIRKHKNLVVIYDSEYDSRQALASLLRVIKSRNKPLPLQLSYEEYTGDINNLLNRITDAKAECIALFCGPKTASGLFALIRNSKINLPVFGPLSVLNEDVLTESELNKLEDGFYITSANWNTQKCRDFTGEYREKYGIRPGMVAAFAYDGAGLVIEAVRKAGSDDRRKIQKALAELTYSGVTGTIRFDDKGNRTGKYSMVRIRNGLPAETMKD